MHRTSTWGSRTTVLIQLMFCLSLLFGVQWPWADPPQCGYSRLHVRSRPQGTIPAPLDHVSLSRKVTPISSTLTLRGLRAGWPPPREWSFPFPPSMVRGRKKLHLPVPCQGTQQSLHVWRSRWLPRPPWGAGLHIRSSIRSSGRFFTFMSPYSTGPTNSPRLLSHNSPPLCPHWNIQCSSARSMLSTPHPWLMLLPSPGMFSLHISFYQSLSKLLRLCLHESFSGSPTQTSSLPPWSHLRTLVLLCHCLHLELWLSVDTWLHIPDAKHGEKCTRQGRPSRLTFWTNAFRVVHRLHRLTRSRSWALTSW